MRELDCLSPPCKYIERKCLAKTERSGRRTRAVHFFRCSSGHSRPPAKGQRRWTARVPGDRHAAIMKPCHEHNAALKRPHDESDDFCGRPVPFIPPPPSYSLSFTHTQTIYLPPFPLSPLSRSLPFPYPSLPSYPLLRLSPSLPPSLLLPFYPVPRMQSSLALRDKRPARRASRCSARLSRLSNGHNAGGPRLELIIFCNYFERQSFFWLFIYDFFSFSVSFVIFIALKSLVCSSGDKGMCSCAFARILFACLFM